MASATNVKHYSNIQGRKRVMPLLFARSPVGAGDDEKQAVMEIPGQAGDDKKINRHGDPRSSRG